ncbi:MAG: RNA pseudouridine synthase [bacterium]|nr:RNA pseudouridine synthase [bacterium]
MTPADFDILYEQGPCLVVGKPPGLLTQAPPGIDCLEARVRAFLQARDGRAPGAHLGVVHRLDRPASGALLLGLAPAATRELSRQIEQRQVRKLYWALAGGAVAPAAGAWEDHVRKVPDEPRAEIVPADHPDARLAKLRYRALGCGPGFTRLEIALETGRTHQIRLQAASRGHPVLGDAQYGSDVPFGEQHDDPRLRAIALHARLLGFRDTTAGRDVEIVAEPPPAWSGFLP